MADPFEQRCPVCGVSILGEVSRPCRRPDCYYRTATDMKEERFHVGDFVTATDCSAQDYRGVVVAEFTVTGDIWYVVKREDGRFYICTQDGITKWET